MIRLESYYNSHLHEDDEEDIEVDDVEVIESDDKKSIKDQLFEIGKGLGSNWVDGNKTGTGYFSISDYIDVYVLYTETKVAKIQIKVHNKTSDVTKLSFDCTKNTSAANSFTDDMQVALLYVSEIYNKIGVA